MLIIRGEHENVQTRIRSVRERLWKNGVIHPQSWLDDEATGPRLLAAFPPIRSENEDWKYSAEEVQSASSSLYSSQARTLRGRAGEQAGGTEPTGSSWGRETFGPFDYNYSCCQV